MLFISSDDKMIHDVIFKRLFSNTFVFNICSCRDILADYKKKKTTTNNPHGTRKIALNPSLRAGGVFEAKTGVKHHRAPAVEIVTELVG